MPRRLLAVPVAALLLAGCGAAEPPPPPPQVTFTAGAASIVARPAQYCDVELTQCLTDVAAPVRLGVPPGTLLQVTVPPEIAQTPWQVVFSYTDTAGAQIDERSPVFTPDGRHAEPAPDRTSYYWSVHLPGAADQLLTAEVQQYGPPPQPNPQTGDLEFPIRASWVLNVG